MAHLRGPSSREGMGGYLDPPGYPTHTYSIGEGNRDNPHSLSSLHCITETAAPEYFGPTVIAAARRLLADWRANRPALDSAEVQAWIANCYRHWASCWYSAEPDEYRSHCASPHSKHPQPRPADAIDYALYHVRQFYPEFDGVHVLD